MATDDDRMIVKGDIYHTGNLTVTDQIVLPAQPRTILTQDSSAAYVIPWTAWRKHDNYHVNLPSAADDGNNYLGLVGGTFGTSNSPSIRTADEGANGGVDTAFARTFFTLPPEYVADGSVVMRFHAGMITAIADATATIDIQVIESDKAAGGVGSTDLCTTAATTINSLTFANIDFTITDTGLVPGDVLDILVAIAINDAATADTRGAFGYAAMLLAIKG
jgi:hypothetical protein